jgi:DNA-directed RNA polymerase sigma subunit (sigma70/sigma32)
MDKMTCAKLRSILDFGLSVLPAVQRDIIMSLYLADVRATRKALMGKHGLKETQFRQLHDSALSQLRSVLKTYRIETVAHVL